MKRFLIPVLMLLMAASAHSQQWGDYTLYATMGGTTANLLDTNGTIFKTWNLTGKTGYSTYMIPGGTLVRTVSKTGNSFTGGPICGQVQKVDWNGNIVWDFVYSTTEYCTHHDICPMPNGNVLLIAYERRTASEATQAGSSKAIEMWPDKIVEIQPTGATTGNVVWEWKAWEHLCQNVDATKDNYVANVSDHPELLNINYKNQKDWLHMNGVDYNPMLDQIVWSSHNTNEWYVIDHSTTTAEAASHSGGNSGKGGDILYRWGNPAAYGATGTAILNVTHDAHWIPEGCPNAGYLVGFNNKGVSASKSSVDQVDAPDSGYNYTRSGAAFSPATYDLRHACNGYTSNMGNSQQLPNGNMLVCVALSGLIYEVDPNGTTIWTKTIGQAVPQSFRYSKCYADNAAPAAPTITSNGTDLASSQGTSYQWYLNGHLIAGATAASYTPTQSGNYLVRITDATSCVFSYSTSYKFTYSGGGIGFNTAAPLQQVQLYPNPSSGIVSLNFGNLNPTDLTLTVSDAAGRTVTTSTGQNQLDLTTAGSGIYFVTLTAKDGSRMVKKLSIQY